MTTIDKAVKDYKSDRKRLDATIQGLEARAAEMAEMGVSREDALEAYDIAVSELDSVAARRASVKDELDEAVRFDDPSKEYLRDEYKELSDREQALRDAMGDATKTIEDNTPDPRAVATLRAQLSNAPTSLSEFVDHVEAIEEAHSDALRTRVAAAVAQLPIPDPRAAHEALKAADEYYRNGEGKTLDEYLASEDDAGRSENATAVLASRLEARDRRAVIRAR